MSDDPIKAASAELQKWLDLLKNYLEKMESLKIQAAKSQLEASRHEEMLKELKGIKEGLNKAPDGPGKDAALQAVKEAEVKVNDLNPDGPKISAHRKKPDDLNSNGPKADEARKVGDDLGWKKGEKGWTNKDGLNVKELGNKVPVPKIPVK